MRLFALNLRSIDNYEPLIALEITQAFEERGARVIVARTLRDALLGVEDPCLSVAILDHVLGTQNSSTVCERMKALPTSFGALSATTVPVHNGRDLPRPILRAIIEQASLTVEELIEVI